MLIKNHALNKHVHLRYVFLLPQSLLFTSFCIKLFSSVAFAVNALFKSFSVIYWLLLPSSVPGEL